MAIAQWPTGEDRQVAAVTLQGQRPDKSRRINDQVSCGCMCTENVLVISPLLETMASADSFPAEYDLVGFQYVVEQTGTLQKLEHEACDACFSYSVFEHIDREIVSEFIQDLDRLLKLGGYAFMTIDTSDRLAHYDPGVCRKN